MPERRQYDEGKAKFDVAKKEFEAGKQKLADAKAELDKKQQELTAAIAQVKAGQTTVDTQIAQLNAQIPQLEAGISQLAAGCGRTCGGAAGSRWQRRVQSVRHRKQVNAAQAAYDEAKQKADAGDEEAKAQLDALAQNLGECTGSTWGGRYMQLEPHRRHLDACQQAAAQKTELENNLGGCKQWTCDSFRPRRPSLQEHLQQLNENQKQHRQRPCNA